MKNVLLDKGIILPSGEISKDTINLVAGAITQSFAEMVWVTTGGDMVNDAITYYKGKHGIYATVDNYAIIFEPSIAVEELIYIFTKSVEFSTHV